MDLDAKAGAVINWKVLEGLLQDFTSVDFGGGINRGDLKK